MTVWVHHAIENGRLGREEGREGKKKKEGEEKGGRRKGKEERREGGGRKGSRA